MPNWCSNSIEITSSKEKIDEFEVEAKKVGSEIALISTETREGVQLKEMGKIAAILRYEVHE